MVSLYVWFYQLGLGHLPTVLNHCGCGVWITPVCSSHVENLPNTIGRDTPSWASTKSLWLVFAVCPVLYWSDPVGSFLVFLKCWIGSRPVGERDHCDWLFSLANHCMRREIDPSAVYTFLSNILRIRSCYKLSVESESGVKIENKCCPVLLGYSLYNCRSSSVFLFWMMNTDCCHLLV